MLTISNNQLEKVILSVLLHESMLYKLDINSINNSFNLKDHLYEI